MHCNTKPVSLYCVLLSVLCVYILIDSDTFETLILATIVPSIIKGVRSKREVIPVCSNYYYYYSNYNVSDNYIRMC